MQFRLFRNVSLILVTEKETTTYPNIRGLYRSLEPEVLRSRNLKGEIRFLFWPCVNTMSWRPYCLSRMEVIYCTFGFGAIIRRDLRTLFLPCDSPRDNLYACVIWGNSRLTKLFGGLSYEKVWKYNKSPPYVMARCRHNRFPFEFPWLRWLFSILPHRISATLAKDSHI